MQMEMPNVQEQHRRLEKLAGSWVGEETLSPSPWDPKGGPAMGKIEARVGLDGFFLISDYVQERNGKVSYRGHGVYGYDQKQGRWTMHWFDNMGMGCTGVALGIWEGDKLIFQSQGEMGHGRFTYTFLADGRHNFKLENSMDGKNWQLFMEGNYRRK